MWHCAHMVLVISVWQNVPSYIQQLYIIHCIDCLLSSARLSTWPAAICCVHSRACRYSGQARCINHCRIIIKQKELKLEIDQNVAVKFSWIISLVWNKDTDIQALAPASVFHYYLVLICTHIQWRHVTVCPLSLQWHGVNCSLTATMHCRCQLLNGCKLT